MGSPGGPGAPDSTYTTSGFVLQFAITDQSNKISRMRFCLYPTATKYQPSFALGCPKALGKTVAELDGPNHFDASFVIASGKYTVFGFNDVNNALVYTWNGKVESSSSNSITGVTSP